MRCCSETGLSPQHIQAAERNGGIEHGATGTTRIHINEVGTRDGFQVEAAFIPTEDKVALVDALSNAAMRRSRSPPSPRPRRSRRCATPRP